MANENLKNGPVNPDAENDEEMTVTTTLDDGTELECVVLTIFEAGEKEYIALLPVCGRGRRRRGSHTLICLVDINRKTSDQGDDKSWRRRQRRFRRLCSGRAEHHELVGEGGGGTHREKQREGALCGVSLPPILLSPQYI